MLRATYATLLPIATRLNQQFDVETKSHYSHPPSWLGKSRHRLIRSRPCLRPCNLPRSTSCPVVRSQYNGSSTPHISKRGGGPPPNTCHHCDCKGPTQTKCISCTLVYMTTGQHDNMTWLHGKALPLIHRNSERFTSTQTYIRTVGPYVPLRLLHVPLEVRRRESSDKF